MLKGNVILTDKDYMILSVLRSHKFEDNAKIAVKEKYPFSHAASIDIDNIVTDKDQIKAFIEAKDEEKAEEPKGDGTPAD